MISASLACDIGGEDAINKNGSFTHRTFDGGCAKGMHQKRSEGRSGGGKKNPYHGMVADSGSCHLAGNGSPAVRFQMKRSFLKEKIFTECLEWVIVHSNEKNGGFSYVL